METKPTNLTRTYNEQQKLSLINTLTKSSKRAICLKDVWDSDEISFKKMEVDHGAGICKTLLLAEITKTVHLLKADMQDVQIDYMVNYIMKHYYSYTISDITCLTDRLVKNNPYGKPILQNLIAELDQYSIEKQEWAVYQRQKENSNHKAEQIENEKILKTYENMKRKAKEPVKSQKQKDAEAKAELAKKIEELQRLYPKTI